MYNGRKATCSHKRLLSVQRPCHEIDVTNDRTGAHVPELVPHLFFAYIILNLHESLCLFQRTSQSVSEEGIARIGDPDVVSPLEDRMGAECGFRIIIIRETPSFRTVRSLSFPICPLT